MDLVDLKVAKTGNREITEDRDLIADTAIRDWLIRPTMDLE